MPVTLLMWLGLGGFFAAAAIGAALLMAHARRKHVSVAPAFIHGFFAGSGLILLTVAVFYGAGGEGGGIGPWPVIALVVFFCAAVLGVTMLYLHVKTGSIPIKLGVAHAALAATGIVTLFLIMVLRAYTGDPLPLDVTGPPPIEQPVAEPSEVPPPGISPRPEGSRDE